MTSKHRVRAALAHQPVDFDYELTYPTPRGDIRIRRQGARLDVEADGNVELVRAWLGPRLLQEAL